MSEKNILLVFAALTAMGYIIITIFLPIPIFIKYENILYAMLYLTLTYVAIRWSKVPLLALIFFNIGRISRSIITSYGEIGRMAREHTPLLIFLVIYGLYLAYTMLREKS